jgi:DNA-binding transcriptional regulator YiaG
VTGSDAVFIKQGMTPKQIMKLRKELGLTQQQLADMIDAQQHTVSLWETGNNRPRGANLKAELQRKVRAKKK